MLNNEVGCLRVPQKRKTGSDVDDLSGSSTADSGEDTSSEEHTPPLKFGEVCTLIGCMDA